MRAAEGTIFEISRFRTDDGPGIRTAVFLKGCPLRCVWCHNPESYQAGPELFYDAGRCVACGACAAACPRGRHAVARGSHTLDRTGCTACGACAAACGTGALRLAGRTVTPEEVMEEVRRDRTFYRHSGGGLTLTGGEPLFQAEFSLALLRAAHREGIGTCVETCGHAPWEVLGRIAAETDIFLYDCKTTDGEKHRALTGVDSRTMMENLRRLDQSACRIVLRAPLVPGLNDSEGELLGLGDVVNSLEHVEQLEVMPYHPLGVGKYRMLGGEARYAEEKLPGEEVIRGWLDLLRSRVGVPVTRAMSVTG